MSSLKKIAAAVGSAVSGSVLPGYDSSVPAQAGVLERESDDLPSSATADSEASALPPPPTPSSASSSSSSFSTSPTLSSTPASTSSSSPSSPFLPSSAVLAEEFRSTASAAAVAGSDPSRRSAVENEGVASRSYRWGESLWESGPSGPYASVFVSATPRRLWSDPDWSGGGWSPDKARSVDVSVPYASASAPAAAVIHHPAFYDSLVILANGAHGTFSLSATSANGGPITFSKVSGGRGNVWDDTHAFAGETLSGGSIDVYSGFQADGAHSGSGGWWYGPRAALSTGTLGSNGNAYGGNVFMAADMVVRATDGTGQTTDAKVQYGTVSQGPVLASEMTGGVEQGNVLGSHHAPVEHLITPGNGSMWVAEAQFTAHTAGVVFYDASGNILHQTTVFDPAPGAGRATSYAPVIQAMTGGSGQLWATWSDYDSGTGDVTVLAQKLDSTGALVGGVQTLYTGASVNIGAGGIRDADALGAFAGGMDNTNQTATHGTDFAVVFGTSHNTNHNLYVAEVGTTGTLYQQVIGIANTASAAHGYFENAHLTAISTGTNTGDWVATWTEQRDDTGAQGYGDNHYMVRLLNHDLTPAAPAVEIGSSNMHTMADPTLYCNTTTAALQNGEVAVVFSVCDGAGSVHQRLEVLNSATLAVLDSKDLVSGFSAQTAVAVDPCAAAPAGGVLLAQANGEYQFWEIQENAAGTTATIVPNMQDSAYQYGTGMMVSGTVDSCELISDSQGLHYVFSQAGRTFQSASFSYQTGGQGMTLNLPDGNCLIQDTTYADTITCGAGTDTLVSSGGADVLAMGSGADTVVFKLGRTVDTTHATISGFDGTKSFLDVSDILTTAQLDATHLRLSRQDGATTGDVLVQVSKAGDGVWTTIADLKNPSGSTNGGFDGTAHATDQAHLDAALSQWESSGHVKGS